VIVILEDALFDPAAGTSATQLVALFNFGVEGRHRVQTVPIYDPSDAAFVDSHLNRWLRSQQEGLREEVVFALEAGLEEDTGHLMELEVRVSAVDEPSWDRTGPRLPPRAAVQLLARPLCLLVENKTNDGAFVTTVAPKERRAQLTRALEEERVEFVHGGGSDIKAQVRAVAERPDQILRYWVMFDSDALQPGTPSEDARELQEICDKAKIAHHMLQRRAAENYLPVKALECWWNLSSGNTKNRRRRSVQAFAAMESPQRRHYNMRHGFNGDRERGIPPLFDDQREHPDLQNGFGASIRDLFLQHEFQIEDSWLARDGQTLETLPMIQSIFRRM
jgi:hypothetical protein